MLSSVHFLLSPVFKYSHWVWTEADFTGRGIPFAGELVACALVCEFAGGLLLLLGLWTRFSSISLLAFVVLTNLVFHQFWNISSAEGLTPAINFGKDLAVIAGLLLFATFGAGRLSIDECVSRWRNRKVRS